MLKKERIHFLVKRWWWLFIVATILITRFVNLDLTARFTQDESSDLLRMEQFWKTKKITLIGPISTDNTKVFGLLTYYMLMPFAAVFNFDPVGPAYGTAFWGVLTAVILLFITLKTNKQLSSVAAILIIIWYPLLETSRWAWNPHLIPFWVGAGILLLSIKSHSLWKYIIAGILFGLTFHLHYIALFATLTYCLIYGNRLAHDGNSKATLLLLGGYVLTLLPFIIFDLRHPPGLFFGRYLTSGSVPHVETSVNVFQYAFRLFHSIYVAGFTVARLPVFALLTMLLTVFVIISDVKSNKKYFWLFIPVIIQILPGLVLSTYETRYFIPAIVFYFHWLIQRRSGTALVLQKTLLFVLIASSLLTLPKQLNQPDTPPSIRVIREVTNTIAQLNRQQEIKNANITTTDSPDNDLLALKYRDVLAIKNVPLRATSEYDLSENLFVISTADIQAVRNDKSVPLQIFKNAKLKGTYPTTQNGWVLYWLGYE